MKDVLTEAFIKAGIPDRAVADKLAGIALKALADAGAEEWDIEKLASGNYDLCDGYCHEYCGSYSS
jgi:hypothetical protein